MWGESPDKLWKQPFFAFQLAEVCAAVCVSLVCIRSIWVFPFYLVRPRNLHQRRLLLILSLSLSSLFVPFVSTADCRPYRSSCVARRIGDIQRSRVPAASPLKTCWTATFVRGNAAWSDFARPCRSPAFPRNRSSAGSSSYRLSLRAGRNPWNRFLGLLTMPTRCPYPTPNLQVSSTTPSLSCFQVFKGSSLATSPSFSWRLVRKAPLWFWQLAIHQLGIVWSLFVFISAHTDTAIPVACLLLTFYLTLQFFYKWKCATEL